MSLSLPVLTTSQQRAYRACQRLHYFEYELLYRPAFEDDSLVFGKLGHHGLEAWWNSRLVLPSQPSAWLASALTAVEAHESDPYRLEASRVLMVAYHARWADAEYEPIAVELEYALPLVNPATGAASRTWRKGGKIDVLVRDADGDVWVMDHKFTREDFGPGSEYRARLTLDPQVSAYVRAAAELGHNVRGWVHDVIARPGQRPLKATPVEARRFTKAGKLDARQREEDESPEAYGERIAAAIAEEPERYFARFPAVRLEEEEREAAFDLWQVGVQIRESRAARAWSRNPDACSRYGRTCAFLPVCAGHASLDDGTRYRRAERAHEELGVEMQKTEEKEGVAAE